MSLGMIQEILDDVSRWEKPLEEIVPVNYGEFFLREDWYKIMTMITTTLPNTTITLASNGARVTERAVMDLCHIPTFKVINFSINAYFDETYKAFTKLPPETIHQIRKAIAMFRVMRPDIRLKVSMVFDPMYQSDLERDYFINYWTGWAEPWVIPAASADRGTEIKIPRVIPCRSIFSDMVIGYDGKLTSCCFDPNFTIDLGCYSGDVMKDWHNEKMTEFRKLHNENRRNEIGICSNCSFE